MRFFLLLLALLAGPAFAETPLPLKVMGRTVAEPQGGYRFEWPGVYFEAAFAGDKVSLRFDDNVNIYRVYVDGVARATLLKPGKTTFTVDGLGAGAHTVRLEKITETQGSNGVFLGFFVEDADSVRPAPAAKPVLIEFIGDSYTVGYGNQSTTGTCTVDEVYSTTDTSAAFGPKSAKALDADYVINASSGYGMVRNYDGKDPNNSLPKLYRYDLFTQPVEHSFAGRAPDYVVIGLGTNDFSTPLKATEKWANSEALEADFEATYLTFVTDVRKRYPNAKIILMSTNHMGGVIKRLAQNVVSKRQKTGDTEISYLEITGITFGGCHSHPSASDSTKLATDIINHINGLK